ncbi:hypothetical protein BASA81_008462 [Batrachochytrium salamandrivorans]|nr:hypothetical protein BASA81_008462 [Batrachochytrium salamandrivorans]
MLGRVLLRARLFSTAAVAATTETVVAKPKSSLLPRVLVFSAFSLTLSCGAVGYTLVTNESTLFWARDKFPQAVNLVAPLLGLPQESASQGTVFGDEEEEQNMDIKQVVGDLVYVCFKLASGQVVIQQCGAEDTTAVLRERVLAGRPEGERVLDISILDSSKAEELLTLSPEALARKMNHVPIPEIPEVISFNSVGVALELCRQTELELNVRLRLSQNESDTINIKRALAEIDARKVLLKKMLKEERSKQGVQSIFRRGR